jgi:hypothetical protein
MKKQIEELASDAGRIRTGDTFTGTAVIYGAAGSDSFGMQCEYEINTFLETRKLEVRAVRENRRIRGFEVQPLQDDRLKHEMLVVFGAEVTAKSAVETLRQLTKKIKAEGLFIGTDEAGNPVFEPVEDEKPWS